MAPPAWTTYPQEEYPKSKRPDYLKAKQDHQWGTFWQSVYQGFFAQWPNQAAEVDTEPPVGLKYKRAPQPVFGSEQDWITDRKAVSYFIFLWTTQCFIPWLENSEMV